MTRLAGFCCNLLNMFCYGSGIGIEIADEDLKIVAVRRSPGSIRTLGELTIRDFAACSVPEWSAEYHLFLRSHGIDNRSAMVLLPRRDVVVRLVNLPGVAPRDQAATLRFQLDTLHTFSEDDVLWSWSAVTQTTVLVGITRRSAIERYVQYFAAAGIAVAGFTFSPAAIHAAIRIRGEPKADLREGFIAVTGGSSSRVEVYGESPAKLIFSAELDLPEQRVTRIALSELRLPPNSAARRLNEVLSVSPLIPVVHDSFLNGRVYAVAILAASPWLARVANLLPQDYRRFSSHRALMVTLVLAGLTLLMVGGGALNTLWLQHRYLKRLNTELFTLEAPAASAAALDRAVAELQSRIQLLDKFKERTSNDLDVLDNLTRLIDPPIWLNSIDLSRDSVRLTGQAPEAWKLLPLLDSSAFFEHATPDSIVANTTGAGETFVVHSTRSTGK